MCSVADVREVLRGLDIFETHRLLEAVVMAEL